MVRRRGQRRRGPRNQQTPGFEPFEDVILSSLSSPNTLSYLRGTFEFPNDRSFYLRSVRIQAVPSAATSPTVLQLRLLGAISQSAERDFVWTSGPIMLGYSRYDRIFQLPKVEITWPRNTSPTSVIFAIDSLCPKQGYNSDVTISATFSIMLSKEQVPAACPPGNQVDARTGLAIQPI